MDFMNPELAKFHRQRLADIQELEEFDTSKRGSSGARMMVGFSRNDEFLSIAAAEVSKSAGLVIKNIGIKPWETNQKDSTVSLCMHHALRLLADAIEVPVVFRLPEHLEVLTDPSDEFDSMQLPDGYDARRSSDDYDQ
jgi:hypothetical protein